MSAELITCRRCRNGKLRPLEKIERFAPPKLKEVEVRVLCSRCDNCGAETLLPSQHEENLKLRLARKSGYGDNLLGEEIFDFRRKYGLSQQDASKLFGLGKIAFSRYENEKSFPEDSTRKLIKMAMQFPDVLKRLADEAGVRIPLWEARVEQVRAQKVRTFRVIRNDVQIINTSYAEYDDEMAQEAAYA